MTNPTGDPYGDYFPVLLQNSETRNLTFDFTDDLFEAGGLSLQGIPTVTITVKAIVPGATQDATPSHIANGSPGFDSGFKMVIVPVDVSQGVIGNDYMLRVTCPTTDPKTRMTKIGILPVR